mmetsp:Transcript_12899/g.21393  ORF Transcript_12899/g.21393 Transcript_12899/m.21393 type:complete len:219 (-) Transcript_12899:259-915(-)|eukprot:CAMPEP_0119004250 /NCGR_PEP_ID=MMETSP1176-20130426/1038_1 /TAXON_ID=265551 /ORGANISM="Synedropsis recta cf, Strain CCMP1620" /LENGTH=218 /DNA_ID=CAMNT_0006955935 /DNA_START=100 /DNA_END=756 /DNA_ORIENTATION=+
MRARDLLLFLSTNGGAAALLFPQQVRRHDHYYLSTITTRRSTRLYSEENSVSDYTLGLHGGKYQFDTAGINFEGQQFAETGYGSTEEYQQEDFSNEPLPKWALRLQSQVPPENCPVLQVAAGGGTVVPFSNEERSWERFYAMIILVENDEKAVASQQSPLYTVEPSVGMMAPRGGSGQYKDTAQVTVMTNELQAPSSSDYHCWLAIGTEEETWHYQLQ